MIITCWILLAVCCVAKLFGANWFIIHTDNQRFTDFCRCIEDSFWYYIFTSVFNIITTSIYLMGVLKQKKPSIKWFLPLIAYAILKSIFYRQKVLFFILDFVFIISIPLLIDRNKWLRIFIGIALNLGFQFVSMFLKLNNYEVFSENAFVSMILSIDYVIMLMLYWLYSIRKEG